MNMYFLQQADPDVPFLTTGQLGRILGIKGSAVNFTVWLRRQGLDMFHRDDDDRRRRKFSLKDGMTIMILRTLHQNRFDPKRAFELVGKIVEALPWKSWLSGSCHSDQKPNLYCWKDASGVVQISFSYPHESVVAFVCIDLMNALMEFVLSVSSLSKKPRRSRVSRRVDVELLEDAHAGSRHKCGLLISNFDDESWS